MQLDFPYHFDGRERTAETGEDGARPRPDRADPLHPARRAGEPSRLRRGRAAARLRPGEPRGRRDRRVHDPRRAAAAPRASASLVERVAVEAEDATLRIRIVYRLLATGEAEPPSSRREAGAMIYHCCDPRRRELVLEHPVAERHRLSSRCSTARRRPRTPRQRTLLLRFLKDAPGADGGQHRDHRRRADHRRRRSSG